MTNKSSLRKKPKRKEMSDKERIRDFQRKLYRKAKQEKEYRFYILYDKIHQKHFLREAYRRAKSNGGSPGTDRITFREIESNGLEKFIETLQEELMENRYKPQPVKRKMILKENGKQRPLGIPTIRDRVVQMSCKMVIEPIFEADFEETSYGFRPKRSAADAIRSIKVNLKEGRTEVLDADLQSYFDTIPHDKLLITVAQRLSDKKVLRLIKQWLKAPIEDEGRISGGKKNKTGIPQGGVISPLLSNIYLHLLDRIICKPTSIFSRLEIKIIRYADDFVLLGKRIPEEAREKLGEILQRMELRLNDEKSRLVDAREEKFDFLGFTIRYDRDYHGRNRKYWNIVPSKKSEKRVRGNIKEFLERNRHRNPEIIAGGLNQRIKGWINYYTIEKVSYPGVSKRNLRWYLSNKLYRFYRRKSQRKSKLYNQGAFDKLVKKYGMTDPSKYRPMTTVKA